MKVILSQDVRGTGKKGDVVDVSDGFANNYLIKRNLAVAATSEGLNSVKIKKEALAYRQEEEKKAARETAAKLKTEIVTLKIKCGESGKIFGSITAQEIIDTLKGLGYTLDKKQLVLKAPIKEAGEYVLDVKLLPEISAKLKLRVEKL